jgi:cytochrome bd-type quinol oxidase subunit 2
VRVALGGSVDVPVLLAAGLTAALFTMHGAFFAPRKSEGEQQEYLKKWASGAWGLALALLVPAVALYVDDAKAIWVRSHPAIFALVASLLVLFPIYSLGDKTPSLLSCVCLDPPCGHSVRGRLSHASASAAHTLHRGRHPQPHGI